MSVVVVLVLSFFFICNASPTVKEDAIRTNEIETDNSSATDPNSAMTGVYTDCFARLSFPCVQQKTLVFIDKLSRLERISLIGDVLVIVKIEETDRFKSPLTEEILTARQITDEATLKALIDLSIDRFFETHVIRLQLPNIFQDPSTAKEHNSNTDTAIDFTIGETIQAEGRKKGGGGGGKKGMKKMMMLMGMMMMTKLMMLAPILMGVVGLAAIKALIFSVASITISKIMILKKLKAMMGQKGGHGGGHDIGGGGGWSSGGGSSSGGYDRSFDEPDGHLLAYRSYKS
ncbi:uncharacterized protein LOC142318291 [Lycorma delicatula]|uniref:uncharacterized protein LOC142318291 n=1 Tax=Lycorma delicatula TaxID=130591 RepID=UPI003F517A1B